MVATAGKHFRAASRNFSSVASRISGELEIQYQTSWPVMQCAFMAKMTALLSWPSRSTTSVTKVLKMRISTVTPPVRATRPASGLDFSPVRPTR